MTVKTAPQAVWYRIYAVMAMDTGEALWVGATINPRRRLAEHRSTAWAKVVRSRGSRVEMVILETCNESGWIEAEQYWIKHFRTCRAPLHNNAAGGPGRTGGTLTEEHRRKISAANKGKIPSPASVASLVERNILKKGVKKSPDHRAKIAAGVALDHKLHPKQWSEETRLKHSGRSPSIETRAKISVSMLEYRKKQREGK